MKLNGKVYYGGYFDNEEHAAMIVNLLCDEYGIKRKNLTINIDSEIRKVIHSLSIAHEKQRDPLCFH